MLCYYYLDYITRSQELSLYYIRLSFLLLYYILHEYYDYITIISRVEYYLLFNYSRAGVFPDFPIL